MSRATSDTRILPVKPSVGLAVVFLIAGCLAAWTAQECSRNLALHHLQASFAPSLLYGCVYWIWWVVITLILWTLADRWVAAFQPSRLAVMAHLGAACALATLHIALLQHTLWLLSWYWPAWGRLFHTVWVWTPERFGVELAIYGFICGACAFLHARMEAQQKLEIERQLAQAQLKALQMQIEPHFLFNTLNALASLVAQSRNREASEMLVHLNTILRITLQRRTPEKVPFTEELGILESYLAIQQTRFEHRLTVTIDASPEARESQVPSFLLQPIIENAIQHGIEPMEDGGSIEACVKRIGDRLWMQVRDNGSGVSDSSTKGHGIGMQNIRERLAYFYPDAYEFDAGARETGGYQVTIQIPYERATI